MAMNIKARSKSGNPIILAVDNAPMFLSTLKRMLEGEPYELVTAATADEALKYVKSHHIDLIFMDIEMPDMDGYDLAKKIVWSGEKAPILFITANHDKEYLERALAQGAAGLLIKPLNRTRLLEKIKEFIK